MHGHLRMDKDRYTCAWKGRPVNLTATEFRLLEGLAIRPGMSKSRDALLEIARGNDVTAGARTMDVHMKRLRQKFRAVDETFNEIETVYGGGYRFSKRGE